MIETTPFRLPEQANATKHERIIAAVTEAIRRKELRVGSELPSITKLSETYSFARETVAKAYRELVRRGILQSIPSKGYYVATEQVDHTIHVFVLLSVFNHQNWQIYHSMKDTLADRGAVKVYFHNYSIELFRQLVHDNRTSHDVFVVKPFHHPAIRSILDTVDPDRLLLIDRGESLDVNLPFVGQDFDDAVYDCLVSGLERIRRYEQMVLIANETSLHPQEIRHALQRFCGDYGLTYGSVAAVEPANLQTQTIYVSLEDESLAQVLGAVEANALVPGKDVGILSYNDSPLKRYIAGGLSVISVDFHRMGQVAADYLVNPMNRRTLIPTTLIQRNSL